MFVFTIAKVYEKNENVDLKLCKYIFSATSNLDEWYYRYNVVGEDEDIFEPFLSIISKKFITCFDGGMENAEAFVDYKVDTEEYFAFEENDYKKPSSLQFISKIEGYITETPQVVERFIKIICGDKDIHINTLIKEVIDNAKLPLHSIEKDKLPIVYTAINLGLMSGVDRYIEGRFINMVENLVKYNKI